MKVDHEISALQSLGFEAEELDLRRYFDGSAPDTNLTSLLGGSGLVWIRGGNGFVLRRSMKASGFDVAIQDFLYRDRIAYGGYSAGVVMLAPSLHGIDLVDDPTAIPAGYDSSIIWECLGILPYHLAPHYRSDHPESADVDTLVQYFIDNHVLFKAMRDGEVIVVDGEIQELVG